MKISHSGSTPSNTGPADWFTGHVRLTPLVNTPAPARLRGASVTFEAGARTAWHTHPLGQTLIVTAGLGLAQTEGGPVQTLRPGDVVWFEPGEKHWHGAAPESDMTHIALQEELDGSSVTWLEHVSDAQYSAPSQ
ncbi:MAG: cupin domain-containing protein [Roseobacter sp.]|nr:cupin domain-containing protein [Roseobacter sp.]